MKDRNFPPDPEFSRKAWIRDLDQYREMYRQSIEEPDRFWSKIAGEFHWRKKWRRVRDFTFSGEIDIRFFLGARTNICFNALDRHLADRGDQPAILWEGNAPGEDARLTYRELHREVCKFANVLLGLGVKKGDRVSIYMPMVMELPIAMLACARIGAVHSVVFGGFSADSLAERIVDSSCEVLVTTDAAFRGAKVIPLKRNADEAIRLSAGRGVQVKHCIVLRRVGPEKAPITLTAGRDHLWEDLMNDAHSECDPVWVDSEDPLFVLYTSGSTGKPKGVLHTTGGYMVYATTSFRWIFDYHDGDIFWCTADIGWVTGHSYIVYGPLCAGATSVMFEGIPTYPDPGRFWDIVDKYRVNQFYTAPTAIRALMREGEEPVEKKDLSSLRLLGTVGEPINPEAWLWYHRVIGKERCPIVDTWWQTETGGILITPLPGAIPTKPGSATLPFFGVKPVIVDDKGRRLDGVASGFLCLEEPWPGMMRTLYGSHERFREIYFSTYPGLYFTGDGCRRDEDGYYWITGRVDDVLNVSGHRLGSAEVESALVSHPAVAKA
ncbi:MAG: acetate--CoA ligase, partial [Acidobacteria bacterium]|nr:acetate--CoA ligase [Acidobacteriota bacterium]